MTELMSRASDYLRELRPTLALAAPIVVGQVSQMLMGVTDSVMIGRTGTVPLAASAFGGNVFSIFYVLGIGLMIPVAILVSRARGAERPANEMPSLTEGGAMRFLDFWASDVEKASSPKEQGQIVRFLGDVRKHFGGG